MRSLRSSQRAALPLLLAITFLSTVGMSIVFPVLPFLVEDITGSATGTALWVGVLEAAYALCALISAPFLGALSDRVGRRPVLVACLLGGAAGWALFGIGGTLWVLLAGRIVAGLFAGDMSVAFAYLADITPAEDRARRFGIVGAVSGIGFLIGPAAGGLLAPISLTAPVFLAAGVTFATALLAAFALPESLAADRRGGTLNLSELNPLRTVWQGLRRPVVGPLLLAFGLMAVQMTILATNIPVLAMDKLSWDPMQVGLLLSSVGLVDIVVQGGLLGILLRTAGQRGVVIGGLLGQIVACAMFVVVASVLPLSLALLVATVLLATSQGATGAVLQGFASSAVGDDEQGWLAGGMSAVGSIAQLAGPLVAGLLYARVAPWAPYGIALVAVIAAAVLVRPLFAAPDTREAPEMGLAS